ncbi:hypothetical protein CY34DRAFT_805984 [Suillus luteus UH-Slu-Lm8-n1]|uniref:Secreted protein n=1 Tax=Suillus luteus UH-Slu-Lm8-n1 TaxID=930992 RepID=A0A0D0BDT0_9AGAM|nr:hypothetical protein CY34DRAFT_805984 [Suillus luteus UH-Slu-Lm8-n1]
MSSLTPLVVFLHTLPLQSTLPSHTAASAILNTLKDARVHSKGMRTCAGVGVAKRWKCVHDELWIEPRL